MSLVRLSWVWVGGGFGWGRDRSGWVVGFVVVVCIRVGLGYSSGWQWLASGVGCAMG